MFDFNSPADISPTLTNDTRLIDPAFHLEINCSRASWALENNNVTTLWNQDKFVEWIWPCNIYTSLFRSNTFSNGCRFFLTEGHIKDQHGNSKIKRWSPLEDYTIFTHVWFWIPLFITIIVVICCEAFIWCHPSYEEKKNAVRGARGCIVLLLCLLSMFFGIRVAIAPTHLKDAELCALRGCQIIHPAEYWLSPYVECGDIIDYIKDYSSQTVSCNLKSLEEIEIVRAAERHCGGVYVNVYPNEQPAKAFLGFESSETVQHDVQTYKNKLTQIDLIWLSVAFGLWACLALATCYAGKVVFSASNPRNQPQPPQPQHPQPQYPQQPHPQSKIQMTLCTDQYAVEHKSDPCAICQETFNKGEALGFPPSCGHMFHQTCIAQWGDRNPTCPVCRLPFSSISIV